MMGSPILQDYADPITDRRRPARLRRFFMSAVSILAVLAALVMASSLLVFAVIGMGVVLGGGW
ncbi:MAG: hypothetical protein D6721_09455 [Gammaproteobacteria bacterium]|nr:MAG: hypothetical protein D6721_09455 [Gammaproteobacteria bacterium]